MKLWGPSRETRGVRQLHGGKSWRNSSPNFDAVLIRAWLREVDTACQDERQKLHERVDAQDAAGASSALERLVRLNGMMTMLNEIDGRVGRCTAAPVYVVSTIFLRECHQYLVRDPSEEMHFVTGAEFGRCRVLERRVTFDKAARTAVGVSGDAASTHAVLIDLEGAGHRLTAWMHSHPGHGAHATRPSTIDLGHQARLERGRCPAIGAIFSRDGYVRFFSGGAPFVIHIYGKGVTKSDERLYKLSDGAA